MSNFLSQTMWFLDHGLDYLFYKNSHSYTYRLYEDISGMERAVIIDKDGKEWNRVYFFPIEGNMDAAYEIAQKYIQQDRDEEQALIIMGE